MTTARERAASRRAGPHTAFALALAIAVSALLPCTAPARAHYVGTALLHLVEQAEPGQFTVRFIPSTAMRRSDRAPTPVYPPSCEVRGEQLTCAPPGLEGSSFTDVVVAPNPYEQRRFGVSYVLTMSRTVVSVGLDSFDDEYIGNALYDNEWTGTHLSFVRTISPLLTFGVGYDRVDRDFTDAAGAQPDGKDDWTGAWLSRVVGRRFSLGLGISKYDRAGAESYDERRYELRFGYSPTDSGAEAMASVGR